MIRNVINSHTYELIDLNKIPRKVPFSYMSKYDQELLYDSINSLYDNVYKVRVDMGISNLRKYKVICVVSNGVPVVNITDVDTKHVRNFIHKFVFTVNYYYLRELVPSNVTVTDEFRIALWDIYHTILFRILNKYLYVGTMDVIKASLVYFLTGRLLSNKIVSLDPALQLKTVKRVYKFVSPDIYDIPDTVTFDSFLEFLHIYNLTPNHRVTLKELSDSIVKYMYVYGESILEDVYYFLSFITSYKLFSVTMNVSFKKYNPIPFNTVNKVIFKEWYKRISE